MALVQQMTSGSSSCVGHLLAQRWLAALWRGESGSLPVSDAMNDVTHRNEGYKEA